MKVELVGIFFTSLVLIWWVSTERQRKKENLKHFVKLVLSPVETMGVMEIRIELSQRGITVTDCTLYSVIREMVKHGEIARTLDPCYGLNQPIQKWRLTL